MKQLMGGILVLTLVGCGMVSEKPYRHLDSQYDGTLPFNLVIGTRAAPELLPPGPGAGVWNSEAASFENKVLKSSAQAYLKTGNAREAHGADAVATFAHYFSNTGDDFSLDVESMRNDLPSVQELWSELAEGVLQQIAGISLSNFTFTSDAAALGHIAKEESENWYLAIAGYSYWVSGDVSTEAGQRRVEMTLHIWDRYDWDPGVVVPINTPLGVINIDQDRVGAFHRQGLAREYDSVGSLVEVLEGR
jgi:hypothetical protein